MFAVALIVFRESLEAALLIGILAAATRGLPGRWRWLGSGAGVGVLGALVIALAVARFPALLDGSQQEIFNAVVLAVAVLMLAWHNMWMASHGAEMAADARRVAAAIRSGEQSLLAVAVVAGLAVLREGSESVLFLLGLAAGGGLDRSEAWVGGAVGLSLGVALGVVVYAGLVRIPLRRLFSVTGVLLLLLAAGMASQAASFLIQADLLPALASPLWDSSPLIANGSPVGSALHVLIGYDARPSGMQLVFFVITLMAIHFATRWAQASRRQPSRPSAASSRISS